MFKESYAFNFPPPIEKTIDEDGFEFGRLLISRDRYIGEWYQSINLTAYSKHYWRGPRGSGKTSFLYLLGRKFQAEGHSVYYLEAGNLQYISKEVISHIAEFEVKGGKRVVLMIDSAHTYKDALIWSFLLRNLKSLIVLAAGVPTWIEKTPDFKRDLKYSPAKIFLQDFEIEEVIDKLLDNKYFGNSQLVEIGRKRLMDFCSWVWKFTGGQIFPILMICDHMLGNQKVFDEHFDTYQHYLTCHEFASSDAFESISNRCLSDDRYIVEMVKNIIATGSYSIDDVLNLDTIGYWSNNWFYSDLMLMIHLNSSIESYNMEINLEMSQQEKIECIIVAGFRKIDKNVFNEDCGRYTTRMGNAIGFAWGYGVKDMIPQLYISPQTHAETGKQWKTSPTVDFIFNGLMSVAIELSKNSYDIEGKIKKFEKGEVYNQWADRRAILNFEMENVPPQTSQTSRNLARCSTSRLPL